MLRSPAAWFRSADQSNTTVTWANVTGKPSSFPPSAHTHVMGDVTGLQAALDGKQVTGNYAPVGHTHVIADVTGLQGALDAKQPAGSYVTTSNFTWTNLAGKPTTFTPSAHTHVWADITDRPTIPSPTPLGTATPKAIGTAAPGSSANAAREDHVHPATGALQFIGNVVVSRTLVLSLSSGMQREYVALTGVVPGDRLMFAAIAACSAGCAPINVYPDTNRVLFEYNTPALGIGAVVNLQIAVYRVQ